MHINNINIKNFRLFENLTFPPSNKINLIIGNNGVGKSTLLEAIYLLARNKSFRTKNTSSLINNQAVEFLITANLTSDFGHNFHIGLKKTTNMTELHIAGKKQRRLTEQARVIPMGIITTNTQKFFTDGPKVRRKFLNWSVFHVEHGYAEIVAKYNKILLQRNTALRNQNRNYRIWDLQLIEYGNEIDVLRKNYINNLQLIFLDQVKYFDYLKDIEIMYKQGWKKDISLSEAIANSNDEINKYTYNGPQRADIEIYINNVSVSECLSSGQLKVLSILLILSQLNITKKVRQESPILLIDDFQSEIDKTNMKKILQVIRNLDCQTFITSINLDKYFESDSDDRLFHVEHGEIY